jgi:hypothetical protein
MAECAGTMPDVARKASKPGSNRKRPKRSPGYIVYARIDPLLGQAWQAYLDTADPSPSVRAAVESAFREYLSRRGLWPFTPPASP